MTDPKRVKSQDLSQNAPSLNPSPQKPFYPPHLNSSIYPQPAPFESQSSSSSLKRDPSDKLIPSTSFTHQDPLFLIFKKISIDFSLSCDIQDTLLGAESPWRTEFSLQFKQELNHLFHTLQKSHPPYSPSLFFAIFHGLQDSKSLSHIWQSNLGPFDVPENRRIYDLVLKHLYSDWIQQNIPPKEAQTILELLL
jgi:hypothetical protein